MADIRSWTKAGGRQVRKFLWRPREGTMVAWTGKLAVQRWTEVEDGFRWRQQDFLKASKQRLTPRATGSMPGLPAGGRDIWGTQSHPSQEQQSPAPNLQRLQIQERCQLRPGT